jgi:hypothetical protein
MSKKDLKTFKLKARGDAGGGKTELLIAFGRLAQSFGMQVHLVDADHHLLVASTADQRRALFEADRRAAVFEAAR